VGPTRKVGSSRVNWWELLGVRQELGEGGERRLVKKSLINKIVCPDLCIQPKHIIEPM